jgi:serine/threonine protein kinase
MGRLNIDEAALVADHIDVCPDCASALTRVANDSDTIVSALRQLPYTLKYSDEPMFKEALARAERVGKMPELAEREVPSSIATDDPARRFIRDYELLEKIGEGGMGIVYKARHTKLKRDVALKLLPAECLVDAEAVRRFECEMEAIGKLAHPNIVSALDAGEVEGTHYLAMELVDGEDLSTLIGRQGPLPVADACELIRQAATGLQRAHECGLVHRDIKPSNLMLTAGQDSSLLVQHRESGNIANRPQVKILDMGLALFAGQYAIEERELTSTTQVMGTPAYMAPEQCANSHAVDILADIYGLGATLYKLLTGKPPFSGDRFNTPAKMMRCLMIEDPPSITSWRKDLPAELVAIVERMLAKEPADRYASPKRVAQALEPLAAGHNLGLLTSQLTVSGSHKTEPASHLVSDTENSQLEQVRRFPIPRWATIAAGSVALILLFAGVVAMTHDRNGKSAVLAASRADHAHASIMLTDTSNITLANSQFESGANTSENPDVTGGAGGPLVHYTATGSAFGGAFGRANLNDGDVGAGNLSDGTYTIIRPLNAVQLRLTFAGEVNLGGIAIYNGYGNRDEGSFTLLDDDGAILGAWDINTTAPAVNDVDSFWLTFDTPVTTSYLTLHAVATDPFGQATVSYREIQTFGATVPKRGRFESGMREN